MPPKSLSHGTLGLKFMNRSSSTIVAPPPGPSVSKTAQPKRVVQAEDDPEWVLPGFTVTPAQQQQSTSAVEVEGSYLPFLLGEKEQAAKEAAWREKSGKGGRRSFGGLNKDVEKLSLPPAPPAPASLPSDPSSSSTPSTSVPVASSSSTARAPPSKSLNGFDSRPRKAPSMADGTILLNQPPLDQSQPIASSSSSGFVRPKGFEDVKPLAPASSSTKKTKKRKSGEVEGGAGGGLLKLGELGLAELAGEGGDDGQEEGAKEKKHGRKNKDRKRARKEAEMRGGG